MFIYKLKNGSGSITVQIIPETKGRYRVVKSIGISKNEEENQTLVNQGQQETRNLTK